MPLPLIALAVLLVAALGWWFVPEIRANHRARRHLRELGRRLALLRAGRPFPVLCYRAPDPSVCLHCGHRPEFVGGALPDPAPLRDERHARSYPPPPPPRFELE